MKIFSWNVNGIRAVEKKGALSDFLTSKNPEIACFQEIKIQAETLEKENFDKKYPEYFKFYSFAEKKGYAGTAIWSKQKPLRILRNFSKNIRENFELADTFGDASKEGRICAAEFSNFWLITVYTPNAKGGLERLDLRQKWDLAFLEFAKNLENGEIFENDFDKNQGEISNLVENLPEKFESKPVIFCGDLNVAHEEIDLARPKTNIGEHGFTDEERAGFSNFVKNGFFDTFRTQNPNRTEAYTWWSYYAKSRERNVGWRIDYFVASNSLKNEISNAEIHAKTLGSDHCPVSIEVKNV